MKTLKLVGTGISSLIFLGMVQTADAVGTITFHNETNSPLNVSIEYHEATGFVCEKDNRQVNAGRTVKVSREWTDLKGYCPIGQIMITGKDQLTRIGSSALPTGTAHIVLKDEKGQLKADIKSAA